MTAEPRVLVADASGLVGQSVVEQFVAAGIGVRVFSGPPKSMPHRGEVVEVVMGGLVAGGPLDASLAGIEAVLLVPDGAPKPEVFARIVGAGVQRIVLLSASSAPWERQAPRAHRHYLAWEQAVEDTGLEWTHLRPVGLMATALKWAENIRRHRVVREGFAAARHPYVHEFDVAAVAVAALMEDGHHGARYLLTGPAAISAPDQVRQLADTIGIPLRFEELDAHATIAQWRTEGYDQDTIDIELIVLRDLVDKPVKPRRTVEKVLHRPALTFSRWASDHLADFR